MNNLCLLFTVLNLPTAVFGETNDLTVDFDDWNEDYDGSAMAPGEEWGSGMWNDELEAPEIAGLDLHDSHDFNPIARGLRWEHDRPVFDNKDIIDLQVYLLEEKVRLLKLKCIKHDFLFGYKDDDLKKLELSILRLKIALLSDPHQFHGISISIKILEEFLELVKAIEELKFKLKFCPIELIHLKYDNHGFPEFRYEQLEKLQVALLKVKVALLKNPHDIKYAVYTKEYLFKLKLAVLKLEIFLYKNPFFFERKFVTKDLLDLIIEIIDWKTGFQTRRFSTIGDRIQHGLRWEHEEPRFDSDDILSLTIAVLKEKDELKKFDCIKHGFKFNYNDDDLEMIKLSLLKLKVALLKNPHAFSPKLLLKVKFVEDLLKIVKELIAIKFKLKPCLIKLIQLKFDHKDFPLFKVADLEKLKLLLLKLKVELLDGFQSHEYNLWTLKYLKSLEVLALKLKIALLKKPLLFGHHIDFDEDDFLKLVKEVIVVKNNFRPVHHAGRRLAIRLGGEPTEAMDISN